MGKKLMAKKGDPPKIQPKAVPNSRTLASKAGMGQIIVLQYSQQPSHETQCLPVILSVRSRCPF